jgi:hypothetical protein
LIILPTITDILCWLAFQDLYPDREVHAELSDEDNIGQTEPAGDDAEGEGAPAVEALAPNPIRSSSTGESHPSAADRTTTVAPSGRGSKKKHVALRTKRKQGQAPVDQVTIDLPPYHRPGSPLDLVTGEHIFGRLCEAFQLASQAARTGTSAGEDVQPSKRAQAPPLKKIIMPKYLMILLLLIMPLTLILILTT